MHIIVVGLNYKTAPVEIREKLSFNEAELQFAMQQLNSKKSVLENVIVSTCNRTEVYAVVDQLHTGRYYIKEFLSDWFHIDKELFTPHLFIYEHDGALEHLFKVASGLDSMVLGETQILGQVKDAFFLAQEAKATGTIFNKLFKQVITLAKKGHTETEIGANAVSVSYAAVALAKKIFGSISDQRVLVLGAGKMGRLAVENLYGSGASNITVINRTLEKAQAVAELCNGRALSIESLPTALAEADIVISSTGAASYVITRDMVDAVRKNRKGTPLFMVDIAVPRDLDPELAKLEDVFLYDIDDLQDVVASNLQERQKAADTIALMIEKQIVTFNEWVNMLGVVPVITELREKALSIQQETMQSIERKMPNLTDRERKVLSKHTKSIINQLLKDPITQVKEMAAEIDGREQVALFKKIFQLQLNDDIQETIQMDARANENKGHSLNIETQRSI